MGKNEIRAIRRKIRRLERLPISLDTYCRIGDLYELIDEIEFTLTADLAI